MNEDKHCDLADILQRISDLADFCHERKEIPMAMCLQSIYQDVYRLGNDDNA